MDSHDGYVEILGERPYGCRVPWLNPYLDTSLEEEEIPEPQSFREYEQLRLQLFDKSHAEAISEYKSLFVSHVSERLRKNTNI